MNFSILPLIIWIIAGILVLCSEKVSKLEYGICWGCLLLYLLARVFSV